MHIDRHSGTGNRLNYDVIVHAFEKNCVHDSVHLSRILLNYIYIFRSDNYVNRFIFLESEVYTLKFPVIEFDFVIIYHDSVHYIALPYKARHVFIFRLVIYFLWASQLINFSSVHHCNFVGHGQCLFLIVSYEYKCDSNFLLYSLQLVLHLFSEFQIQRTQRFIQ